jgi:hypothetical protein
VKTRPPFSAKNTSIKNSWNFRVHNVSNCFRVLQFTAFWLAPPRTPENRVYDHERWAILPLSGEWRSFNCETPGFIETAAWARREGFERVRMKIGVVTTKCAKYTKKEISIF